MNPQRCANRNQSCKALILKENENDAFRFACALKTHEGFFGAPPNHCKLKQPAWQAGTDKKPRFFEAFIGTKKHEWTFRGSATLARVFICWLLAMSVAFAGEFPKIGHYTSNSWGFSTNSFWLEGPTGVVLVDTQFLPSATQELFETAERYTGKNVVLALVLHANPDKFNGTGFLQARGVRVITSAQVRGLIPSVDELRRKWFYQRYQPDYPDKLALPESFGEKNAIIKAAGLKLEVFILGQATSKAHVVLRVDRHVFVGDLLANRHHSWLELGLINEWLTALKAIEKLRPRYLYPGRGYPSDVSLLNKQRQYLITLRDVIAAAKPRGDITPQQQKQLVDTLSDKFAGYQNDFFLERAVSVLWEKLRTK